MFADRKVCRLSVRKLKCICTCKEGASADCVTRVEKVHQLLVRQITLRHEEKRREVHTATRRVVKGVENKFGGEIPALFIVVCKKNVSFALAYCDLAFICHMIVVTHNKSLQRCFWNLPL